MPPSTTHSHIKAVYRRCGSRSRLCVLQMLDTALQHHHLRSLLQAARSSLACTRRHLNGAAVGGAAGGQCRADWSAPFPRLQSAP